MTDSELLEDVKEMLGVTGTYQDKKVQLFINDVKAFMKDAGVKNFESKEAVGCIFHGVSDLWYYGAGTAKLSEYVKQRVIQLASGR